MKTITLYIIAALVLGCARTPQPQLGLVEDLAFARSEAAVRRLVTGEARLCPPEQARYELRDKKLLLFGWVNTAKAQGQQGRHLQWGTIFDLPSMSIEMATFDSPLGGTSDNQIKHRLAMPIAEREQRAAVFRTWLESAR